MIRNEAAVNGQGQSVLLLGAGGQLGALIRQAAPATFRVTACDSAALDITDADAVAAAIEREAPDVIVNAAACTRVDDAETEPDRAHAVNAAGPANLAAAAPRSTRIIHFSTDFVFDGRQRIPYRPGDAPNPLGVYGASKLAGERALLGSGRPGVTIIRTAWLYAAVGRNFLTTMLKLMASRDALTVVDDQTGTPTSAHTLAAVVWRFIARPEVAGIFHWTDRGETSWYGFAREIQRQALELGVLEREIPVRPVTTAEYPTPAARPAYSVLDNSAAYEAIGFKGRPWQQELRDVLKAVSSSL